jgi:hypothetical protein
MIVKVGFTTNEDAGRVRSTRASVDGPSEGSNMVMKRFAGWRAPRRLSTLPAFAGHSPDKRTWVLETHRRPNED